MRIWRETGEIITDEEFQQRIALLAWAEQNKRLDSLSLINNAILTLGVQRRTVWRRRITHWLRILTPVFIALIVFVALAILLHQPAPHCEPYSNC